MNLFDDFSTDGGIIRLYNNANLATASWRTSGDPRGDITAYFFIPDNFIHTGTNTFTYNLGLKLVREKAFDVYGSPHGVLKTEPITYVTNGDFKTSSLHTDSRTKLPYLVVPEIDGITKSCKKYFVPCSPRY